MKTPSVTSLAPSAPQNDWAWAIGAFLLLYAPIYWEASQNIWGRDEYAHAPMILLISGWLAWQKKNLLLPSSGEATKGEALGWMLLCIALVGAFLGRILTFSIMEFAIQPFALTAICLILGGVRALKTLWFPIVFLVFMIPLPGSWVDATTGTLKQWVSVWVETLLAAASYPVGRTGVMLTVGHYQLLVADACSGMHSMFTLTSMGALVLYLRQRSNPTHLAVMLAAIFPIAFVANMIRVMALVLITYHLGDEAGQGFMHGAAGIVLIVVALLGYLALDALMAWALKPRREKTR
jgi:exosortase B